MKKYKEPTIIPCHPGKSFFNLIKDHCFDEASGNSANRACHRLCSLMRKMKAMAVVVENPPIIDMVKDEVTALQSYYGKGKVKFVIYKLTFVNIEIKKTSELQGLKDNNFLASCIVINFKGNRCPWVSYIFQSFVTAPKIKFEKEYCGSNTLSLLNNYLHLQKNFTCEVSINKKEIRSFTLKGTFFCQQNTVTSVCAHAAICMAINNMNIDVGQFVTPEYINGILDFDHHYKKLKLNGQDFHKADFEKVFNQLGLSIAHKDFSIENNNDNIEDYDSYLYRYIESKCPTLLVFSTDDEAADHVVPIFGHTLNRDMWTPEAKIVYSKPKTIFDIYKSTALWVDHFIIHDDNLGMYYCLPTYALKKPTNKNSNTAVKEDYDSILKAKFVISIVPNGVLTSPREAHWATASVLHTLFEKLRKMKLFDYPWIKNFISSYCGTHTPRVVAVRTFLISKEEYMKSLQLKDFDGGIFSDNDKENIAKNLPDRFWLSEVTLPDIFTANQNKIIDFFYSCSEPTTDDTKEWEKRWIQIRLPGLLLLNKDGLTFKFLSVKSHYPLVRMDIGEKHLEW